MASRRTGLWLLTTFLFFLLVFTVFVWGLNRMLVGGSASLGSGTVLEIPLRGAIGEIAQRGPFLGPLTVREIDEAIRRAADDDRVDAIFLDVGPVSGGYGKAQEIRAAVHRFRNSGKPVVALLENGTNLDLYLAAAADTVYQVPSGQLILGFLVQEPFYRDLFDKIGVEFEVFTSGPFKTLMHSFTNRELTDAQREMDNSLLDSLYGQWLDGVGADRGLERAALQASFDRGLVSARQALADGLVDELGYRDQVHDRLAQIAGGLPRRVGVRDYLRATQSTGLSGIFGQANAIALIHVSGIMLPGEFEDSLFGANVAAGTTIARYVREAREDRAVRAIVLRIDSGGGAVTAADVMGREIELAAQRKPVVVSMSDVAASGGYWIAAHATQVLANPGTYTGSIGVVMGRINLQGTYELLGINHEMLKRGENADLLTDAAPLRPAQADILEASLHATYDDFINLVAAGRDMELDAVDALGRGRVWTGQQAADNGLVDELGGLHEALIAARAEAGIAPGRHVAIRIYPPSRTLFEEFRRIFSARTMGVQLPTFTSWLPVDPVETWRHMRLFQLSGPVWTLMDAALPAAAR